MYLIEVDCIHNIQINFDKNTKKANCTQIYGIQMRWGCLVGKKRPEIQMKLVELKKSGVRPCIRSYFNMSRTVSVICITRCEMNKNVYSVNLHESCDFLMFTEFIVLIWIIVLKWNAVWVCVKLKRMKMELRLKSFHPLRYAYMCQIHFAHCKLSDFFHFLHQFTPKK